MASLRCFLGASSYKYLSLAACVTKSYLKIIPFVGIYIYVGEVNFVCKSFNVCDYVPFGLVGMALQV